MSGEENTRSSRSKLKNDIKYRITLTDEQKQAKGDILTHPFNFLHGKAGTGKTLLACQIGLDLLFKKEMNQIIITRPTVATEDNGFLPGNLVEKMEPWMVPIKSNLYKLYNKDKIDSLYNDQQIEIISLSHFRGRTFDDALVIIDEYQNLTKSQLRMAIGRLGKNSIMIFCGDPYQVDLKGTNQSACGDLNKIKDSKFVYITTLIENHRHESIQEILKLLEESTTN